jgi:hypothetical protein
MTDDLERRLRDLLRHAQLPSAPDRLYARVAQAAAAPPARRRTLFGSRWLLLPIAALLVIALAASLVVVGGALNPTATSTPPGWVAVLPATGACAELDAVGNNWVDTKSPVVAAPGDVVFVFIVVSESPSGGSYPWDDLSSSDTSVLRPIALCPLSPQDALRAHSLPHSFSAFLAVAPGAATLSAPLSPTWQPPDAAPSDGYLGPIRLEVRVQTPPSPTPTTTPSPTSNATLKFVTPGPTPWPSNACGGFHLKVVNEDTGSITVTINGSYAQMVDGGTSQTIVEWLPPNKPLMPWTVVVTGADGTRIGSAYMTGPVDQKIIVSGGQMEYGPYDIRTDGCG